MRSVRVSPRHRTFLVLALVLALLGLSLPSFLSSRPAPPGPEPVLGAPYEPLVISPPVSPPPAPPEGSAKASPPRGKEGGGPPSLPLRDPFAYEPRPPSRPPSSPPPLPPLPALSPPALPPPPPVGAPDLPERVGEAVAQGGRAALVVRWQGEELVLPHGVSLRLEDGVALARKEGGRWRFFWNGKEVRLQ